MAKHCHAHANLHYVHGLSLKGGGKLMFDQLNTECAGCCAPLYRSAKPSVTRTRKKTPRTLQ